MSTTTITRTNTFQVLAEPTRRTIIEMLAENGELAASDIYEHFDVSAPAISQHLKVLHDANFVQVERRAQQRIYTINTESLQELEDWAHKIRDMWNKRFDALDKLLEEEKSKNLKL